MIRRTAVAVEPIVRALEYVVGWLRAQENHVLGVPPEVVPTLLGYDVHPPFIGYVDGRHPRRTLPSS